ncbi:MAG: hypothetical protein FWB78_10125 [Treponema sp.]|nr:hypothetical protein [Treponema sp.]
MIVVRKAGDNAHVTTRNIKLLYSFAALVAFVGGLAIYALFRNTDNMVLFRYFPRPLFLDTLHIPIGTDTPWGYLFAFNLPHGLWCLSALLVIRAVWLTNVKWRAVYAGVFLVAASLAEIVQLSANVPGTFDLGDLASYGIAAFVESLAYNKITKRRVL